MVPNFGTIAVDSVNVPTDWALTLVCEEEAKGPVSAMANLGPHIINSEGQKVCVHE